MSLSRHQFRLPHRLRHGVIMVFVLGVLTLLALVGLLLITRTHGEARRLAINSNAAAITSAMNGVIGSSRSALRNDIWGFVAVDNGAGGTKLVPDDVALDGDLPLASFDPVQPVTIPPKKFGDLPYDAPGKSDRWLASITPYIDTDATGNLKIWPTGNVGPLASETEVLVWPYVSYLGSDLMDRPTSSGISPFMWKANSRPPTAGVVTYSASKLEKVPILQTPPPGIAGSLIPGSTTNVTIAQARALWSSQYTALQALSAPMGVTRPQFPYFDTNGDGILDLYDADGDGIPDSPLSFAIPLDSTDAASPHRAYAAIRIVDHCGMVNVNAASSVRLPGSASALMFDESKPGFQRRGERTTELLLDDVVHPQYSNVAARLDRTKDMLTYRGSNDPELYDSVVRGQLAGGTSNLTYFLYGLADEASLRHRNLLMPYSRRQDLQSPPPPDFRQIDLALSPSLAWSRQVNATGDYSGTEGRWARFNADFNSPNYEGYQVAAVPGWRRMLREDEPFALRRHFLTTMSHDSLLPPPLSKNVTGVAPYSALETRLKRLWAIGMDWPVLIPAGSPLVADPNRPVNTFTNRYIVPAAQVPPDQLRVLPIDLNMRDPSTPAATLACKDAFVRYCAAAMYMALEGVGSYQGIPVASNSLNREYLAWQFAANVADYRDPANAPSAVPWPTQPGRFIFGTTQQPFFTEAFAYLTAGTGSAGPMGSGDPDADDKWFFAVELYVPPYWKVPTANLYFRMTDAVPPVTRLIPLGASFSPLIPGLPPAITPYLDGGATGQFFVFCGSLNGTVNANIPIDIFTRPSFRAHAYKYSDAGHPGDFRIGTTGGTGKVSLVYSPTGISGDPLNHYLDLIGPNYSGSPLCTNGINTVAWATNTGLTAGDHRRFSLRRSMKGWRFPVGWHLLTDDGPIGVADPGTFYDETLGAPNTPMPGGLDDNIPEIPWPMRTVAATRDPPISGFASGTPYNSFESAGELSRMLMVGSMRFPTGVDPPNFSRPGWTPANYPLTAALARVVAGAGGFTPLTDVAAASRERYAAGHPDFNSVGAAPWARKLFAFFTTQSAQSDGFDNDGDAAFDDVFENTKSLNRAAARININTAPASVLRAAPYMSFLPSSAEYVQTMPGGPPPAAFNYAGAFTGAVGSPWWDFASAIVAKREGRPAPLRLWNGAAMTTVAVAKPVAATGTAFASLGDLAGMTDVTATVTADPRLFRIDRFVNSPLNVSLLRLQNHRLAAGANPGPQLGVDDYFSPDFRYRGFIASTTNGVIDYAPIADPAIPPAGYVPNNGGLRARDIFLARWANVLTTRSDVFTVYIALIDENGNYLQRSEVTVDRSECLREGPPANGLVPRTAVLPGIVLRTDTNYSDDTR